MRRWNGWGDESVTYPLPDSAESFLQKNLGIGKAPQDATFVDILNKIPPSRLPDHLSINREPENRALHARGQSLPDWIALRSGNVDQFPDGVAYPITRADVQELIQLAQNQGIILIPYGGGTSVLGHINPLPNDRPVLTVDMRRLNQLLRFDDASLLATFGAGVVGPYLEAKLRAHNCTLGHYPQSFEYSSLGGWIATRSAGQQSLGYGRIENLFAGGILETPQGSLELNPYPASAAGPDLCELVLGSEGRLGILTEVIVRATLMPECEDFQGVFFPDFSNGLRAVRNIVQTGLRPSMLRLSTALETQTTLALAGHENLITALERLLAIRGIGEEKCLLLIGFTGSKSSVKYTRNELLDIARKSDGVHVGKRFGDQWYKSRFRTPYLRNTLWELGYAVDTVETAVRWSELLDMLTSIESTLREGLANHNEHVHVFSHLSHIYPTGSSIYTTYLFRIASTPEETLHRWDLLKNTVSQQILKHGGTISHQHGVGKDHLPYLPFEKSTVGVDLISNMCTNLDPKGIMNPGKLVDPKGRKN